LVLPAGPLAFAIGAEERREEFEASVDGLFANGLALGYNPASTFAGGVRRSRAGFMEVGVPVTSARQARPGLRQIDFTAAVRQERIEPGGTATLPKFGLRWRPVDDGLTVRSTWARGFVAPSIFDLFGPAAGNSPSFTLLEGNGSSSPGGGTGRLITGGFGTAIELSNPLLASSRSESLTAGLVLAPRRLPGLTFTADYYEITQDEVGAIDYTSVYADLNARGAASVYAAGLVFADGSRLESNAPNQVTTTNVGSLRIARDPSGDRRVEGIDLAVDYVVPGERAGRFNLGASASVLLGHWFRPTPQDRHQQYARVFTDGANGLGGPAGLLPGYVLKPYVHHRLGPLASSLFLTYLPAVDAPGTLFGGRRATNTQRLDGMPYVIPDYFTVDLGVAYTLPNFKRAWLRDLTATAGANNLLNREAPYVPGGGNIENEGNTAKHVYDIVGRFLYVELKKAF
jgi:iron complex outermembrane receptor protein